MQLGFHPAAVVHTLYKKARTEIYIRRNNIDIMKRTHKIESKT